MRLFSIWLNVIALFIFSSTAWSKENRTPEQGYDLITCATKYQEMRKAIGRDKAIPWLDFAQSICKLRYDGLSEKDLPAGLLLPKDILPEFKAYNLSDARRKTCSIFYKRNLKNNSLGDLSWNGKKDQNKRGYYSICLQSLKVSSAV